MSNVYFLARICVLTTAWDFVKYDINKKHGTSEYLAVSVKIIA